MKFIHEQFNQYFTQKIRIKTVNLLQIFFFKILHLTQQFYYEFLQIRECLLQHMIFSAWKWEIFLDKRFSFSMLRRIPQKKCSIAPS